MIYYLNSLPSSGPSAAKYIANFDFTQSLTDSVNGMIATIGAATRDSNGVHLSASNSYINIADLKGIMYLPIFTIEVDVGACNATPSSDHKRFILWNNDSGFIFRSTGNWNIYNNGWQEAGSSDINAFSNSTLKMKFYFDHKIEVYKNNTLFYSDNNVGALNSPTGLLIGSTSASFYDVYIKAVRAYYD